jgi:DNA-directed RNA polymerase specialized sigma24 family protein
MDHEFFSDLVWKSQLGDADALEQLLLAAYTPVTYLTGRLLENPQTARQVTREVLETISVKLNTLNDTDHFDKWMCKMTAARCVQAMPLHAVSGDEACASDWDAQFSDGQILTEQESAQLIQQLVDILPERQRLCILLLCCGELGIHSIAQVTGFSCDTVKDSITKGQNAVQNCLWKLQERNIQLTGLTSLSGILRVAMYQKPEHQDPIPLVYDVLGKEIPVPPDPQKIIIRILTTLLLMLVAGILVCSGILAIKLLA